MRLNALWIAIILQNLLAINVWGLVTRSVSSRSSVSSTVLNLAYTGTYNSRHWSEEENDFLLALREEHLNPETGKVRRGSWEIICSKLSAMTNEKVEVAVAQHQADNVMRRRQGELKRRQKNKEELMVHKWSDEENDVLMEVRKQYLDTNGRVMMGAWPNITREVSAHLGFDVGIHQASKRAKDIVRKQDRRRIERGSSALEFVTTKLDPSLVDAMLSAKQNEEDEDATLYQNTVATRDKRVTKDLFRAWSLEDTKLLVRHVEEEEERLTKEGRGGSRRRPRGFWVDIADRLNRCPTQCQNRYSWLAKVDKPLFELDF